MNFSLLVILFIFSKVIFLHAVCCDLGPTASLPKKGVLQIFIAVEILSGRPGLNPRTLGPVISMITITPLRWLAMMIVDISQLSVNIYQTRRLNIPEDSHLQCCGITHSNCADGNKIWSGRKGNVSPPCLQRAHQTTGSCLHVSAHWHTR
jgi:hypothetical protein